MFALKSIVLLSVIALVYGTGPRHSEAAWKIAIKCQEEFVPDVPIKEIIRQVGDDVAENIKCYSKCTYEKSGIINEDGTFNREKFDEVMHVYASPEIAKTIGDACTAEPGDLSDCSAVFEIQKCSMAKLVELVPSLQAH